MTMRLIRKASISMQNLRKFIARNRNGKTLHTERREWWNDYIY